MNPVDRIKNEFVPAEATELNYTNHRETRDGLNILSQNQSETIQSCAKKVNIFNTIVSKSENETNTYFNNSMMERNHYETIPGRNGRTKHTQDILLDKSFLKINQLEDILENEKTSFKNQSNQVVNHFEALINKTQNLQAQVEKENELMLYKFTKLKDQIKEMQTSFETDFTFDFEKFMKNYKSTHTNTDTVDKESDEVIVCAKTNKNNQNSKILKNKPKERKKKHFK